MLIELFYFKELQMIYKKLLLSTCLILYSCTMLLYAQETVNAGGGEAKGGGGSLNYTIGQIVYTTDNGLAGSVAKGVQQAYEISTVKSIESLIELECSVYPNPTVDVLSFKLLDPGYEDLNLKLQDMTGKVISSKDVVGNKTKFNMRNMSGGVYFLRVLLKDPRGSQEVRVFKIIKN